MQRNAYWSVILAAVTADEAAGVRMMQDFDRIVTYVTGTGTIDGGSLTIEEAADEGYLGTWSEIDTVDLTDVTGGAGVAVHLDVAAYRAIRWRIDDAVTGGGSVTVSVGAH